MTEIGNLTNLTGLVLNNNRLTSLPAEVCDLQKTGTGIIIENTTVCNQ